MVALKAVVDNNLSIIKNDLELNLMFHIKPIEKDGLQRVLYGKSQRLCKLYDSISVSFEKLYGSTYPVFIESINAQCRTQKKN